jgi:hypothetical protein
MMKRYVGPPDSAIWLLGDSNPVAWQDYLDEPLDKRFPTRHVIWTPIESVIQRCLFAQFKMRLDDNMLYVRNAVEDPEYKRKKEKLRLAEEIAIFGKLMSEYRPLLVLCFGQFAFEFARRARQESGEYPFRHWSIKELAKEFSGRSASVSRSAVNVLPLLHAVVAQKLEECHGEFSGGTGNYFTYVGGKIAEVFVNNPTHPGLSRLMI